MKPIEVGFDGSFQIWSKHLPSKTTDIRLAELPTSENFSESSNPNFQLPNTFLWIRSEDPRLLYRNKDGTLYNVNFESIAKSV